MLLRQVITSLLVTFVLKPAFAEEYTFDGDPEHRCITPKRKPGKCTALHQCATIYSAFQNNAVRTDPTVKAYLKEALCFYHDNVPYVCCDIDAGACTTAENKIGACIEFSRCDPIINYLSMKPFFNEEKAHYMRLSKCDYKEDEYNSRVCCPFIHTNITGKIFGLDKFRPNTDAMPIIAPKPLKPVTVVPRVSLPTAGDDDGNCGAQGITNKIINGKEADIFDYPWMALLQYDNGEWNCGGSLIHPRYVLTAAHCVTGEAISRSGNLTNIRLGEWDLSSEQDCVERDEGYEECADIPVDIEPEEIMYHSKFNYEELQHDIALIRLTKPAPLTDFIKPICLPVETIKLPVGQILGVAGWGRTINTTSSDIKLYLDNLPVYDKDKCVEKYSKAKKLHEGQICVGGLNEQDSCTGDSGSPLMFARQFTGVGIVYFQVGIVSFGLFPCGKQDVPAVYTYVEHYMDWIYENMRP